MTTTTESKLGKAALFHHLGTGDYSRFRNLHFTESGWARLWATAGFFQGAGADGALEDLEERMEYLNGYGGNIERTRLPRYRVAVSDDGCWGSFGLVWFQAIANETIHKHAEAKGMTYPEALDDLKVDQELKLFAGHQGYQHYQRSFVGGLIWHWRDDVTKGSYSIHT